MWRRSSSPRPATTAGPAPISSIRGGILRAKTATHTLHVRPGKNICFVRAADSDTVLDRGVARVAHNGGDVTITLGNNATVAAKKAAGGAYDTPVDFVLAANGTYTSGQHVGHTITAAFDGGETDITLTDINRVKATQVNPADTAITGQTGDVDIVHQ